MSKEKRRPTTAIMQRYRVASLLELAALWGIAVVQPLLGVLGSSVETFVINGIMPATIIPLAIAFALLPPLAVWGIEGALYRLPRVQMVVHRSLVAALVLIFAAQIFKVSFDIRGVLLVLLAVATATGLMFALFHLSWMGQWLRFLSVVPILTVALFALNSPTGRYALSSSETYDGTVTTNGSSLTFVMFDEFPLQTIINSDGTIDKQRFPNFHRLSQVSTWYRNFSASAEATVYAVPAALSGKKPDFDLRATFADHKENLFNWLSGTYKMNVSEVMTRVCPSSVCKQDSELNALGFGTRLSGLWSEAFDAIRQRVDPTGKIVVDTSMAGAFEMTMADQLERSQLQIRRWDQWLSKVGPNGCPCLNYVHMLLPHEPWAFAPDGTAYLIDRARAISKPGEWELAVQRQRHAMQAQYADKLIGDLLDSLESQGLLDTTQLVVMADHGISFDEGYLKRYLAFDFANYPSIMFPPLFIHRPGQTVGEISDANIESIDIMNLVAEGLGSEWPWESDGLSFKSGETDRGDNKTLFLQPGNSLLKRSSDETFEIDAKTAQKAMFAGAHQAEATSDYLAPLYGGTPYDSLRGTKVPPRVKKCDCSIVVDNDLRKAEKIVLFVGVAKGDTKEGDWFAFTVDNKVSGLSPAFERDGNLFVMAVLDIKDYSGSNPEFAAYRIIENGQSFESVKLK